MASFVRYDLHLHTHHSYDCLSSYKAIIRAVQARGLTGIAVTDHNTMRGAKELARIAPFPVILGEEIRTREGEIIGYFMQEELPRGLGLEETIQLVHEQGGLVAVPHPVDRLRRSSALGAATLLRVIEQVDLIEGQNGRCLRHADNLRAQAIARQYGLPLTAGSDAHSPREIGRCTVTLAPFDGPAQFLAHLRLAQVGGKDGRLRHKLFSSFAKVAKRLGL